MSTTDPTTDSERTIRIMQAAMHVLFVVLLVVGVIRALAGDASPFAVIAATVVFTGVYLSGLVVERRARRAQSLRAAQDSHTGQVWIIALTLAWCLTLAVAPDFAWVAFALYFLVLHVAIRPIAAALVPLVLVASVAALVSRPDGRNVGTVIGPIMGMIVALGISWVYAQLRAENTRRRELVTQLVAAQDDVLATQETLALAQHRAGVLAERERLAHDIHDTLAQGFSSIVLLSRAGLARNQHARTQHASARATRDSAAHAGDEMARLLEQIESTAAQGLADSREVVHALTPSDLVDAPLSGALERLTARLTEHTGIRADTTCDGEPRPLPAPVDVALLRIAQSALANVRTHSKAQLVGVTLSYRPDEVGLEVIDDGVGFTDADVERAPLGGSGFGLRAMRERLDALGGHLEIESQPGEGAALIATIPTSGPYKAVRQENTEPAPALTAGVEPHVATPTESSLR